MSISEIQRVLAAVLVATVVIVAMALAGSRSPGWLDPAAHVVDGYWVGEERPCAGELVDCGVAIRAALDHLRSVEPASVVVSAATTYHLASYVARDGQTVLNATSGLARTVHVILDLADGRRRLVGVTCSPVPVSLEEPIILETVCRPTGISAFQVGHEPWARGSTGG